MVGELIAACVTKSAVMYRSTVAGRALREHHEPLGKQLLRLQTCQVQQTCRDRSGCQGRNQWQQEELRTILLECAGGQRSR